MMIINLPGFRFYTSTLLLLSLMLFSTQLSAALVYLDDNRRVEVAGGSDLGNYSTTYTPDSPYADFNHASQTSSLTSTGFSASGSGSVFSDVDWSSSMLTGHLPGLFLMSVSTLPLTAPS